MDYRNIMKIGDREISQNSPVFFIAEVGVNHNGDMKLAKEMIESAAACEVDCVKFQTFNPSSLVTSYAPKADYQSSNTDVDETQLEMLTKLSLAENDYYELRDYTQSHDMVFLSTPFDILSLQFLVKLNVNALKVGSGEITNKLLLQNMANSGLPTIISTGMSNLEEITQAVSLFDKSKIALLHCVSSYPAPYEQVNLRAMKTLEIHYDVPVGFSDHTLGNETPLAAVAMGAKIIEKHFTLDKTLPGPDHKASIEVPELKLLMRQIRNIEAAFGNGIKEIQPCEINTRDVARKSLVAARDLKAGEKIQLDLIDAKRPGTGISPFDVDKLIGKRLIRDIQKDQMFDYSFIE